MKKVLYLTPYFPYPLSSGGILQIYTRLKMLHSMERKIDLVCLTKHYVIKSEHLNEIEKLTNDCKVVVRKKATISFFLAFISALLFRTGLFLNLIPTIYQCELTKKLDTNDYDYIICEHTYLAYWFIMKFPNFSTKTVCIVNNIEADWYYHMFQSENNIIKKIYYYIEYIALKKIEPELFRSTVKFCFLSTLEERNVAVQYNSNIKSEIIPGLPIDLNFDRDKLAVDKKTNTMLFVARLDSARNVRAIKYIIEEVLPLVVEVVSDVQFMIVGKGASEEIKQYLVKTVFNKNIQLIGEVSDLKEYYARTKIVLVPVLESIGVQTKLFEAVREGAITLCTRQAVAGTIFDAGQGVLIADSPKDFADKCIEAISDNFDESIVLKQIIRLGNSFNSRNVIAKMEMLINNGKEV